MLCASIYNHIHHVNALYISSYCTYCSFSISTLNRLSAHRCISSPHRVMARVKHPPAMTRITPTWRQQVEYMAKKKRKTY